MNLPKAQNTISWNSVFSAVIALVAAGTAYGVLRGDVQTIQSEQGRMATRAAETRSILADTRSRLTALEIRDGRVDQRLESIEAGIARIERLMREDRQ